MNKTKHQLLTNIRTWSNDNGIVLFADSIMALVDAVHSNPAPVQGIVIQWISDRKLIMGKRETESLIKELEK